MFVRTDVDIEPPRDAAIQLPFSVKKKIEGEKQINSTYLLDSLKSELLKSTTRLPVMSI